jgi:hypothetical protein
MLSWVVLIFNAGVFYGISTQYFQTKISLKGSNNKVLSVQLFYPGIFEASVAIYTIFLAFAFISGFIATYSDPTDPIVKHTKRNLNVIQ